MTEATTATPENTNEGSAAETSTQGVDTQTTLTTDAQTDAATAADSDAQATTEEQSKTNGAPESYDFKAPEGHVLDDKVMAEFEGIARELNLPQESAQKFVDKLAPLMQARQQEAMEAARTEWADTTKADSELGGAKLDANLATAKKALDQFGTPELRTLLNDSGLGNHPEVIRLLFKAGKAISEDTFVAGRQSGGAPTASHATALYPSQNP